MLAIVNLTASLSGPGRVRVARFDVEPEKLAIGAAIAISLVALGAVAAWSGIYVGGTLRPVREVFIAGALLVAIVAQPVFAFLVARALDSER